MNDTDLLNQCDQLLAPDQKALPMEEAHIVSAFSSHIILHDGLDAALRVIENAVAENEARSELRHCIVFGDAGCGKTTLLDILKLRLPQENEKTFRLGIRAKIPMVSLSLPSAITPRSMAQHMLRAIGDQTNLHGTCFELTERLCRYVNECGVRVVFLDEFHHLLALGRGTSHGANSRLLAARNWIKSVINNTSATFVLMGVPETCTLVEGEEQLSRRFTHIYEVAPFDAPSDGNTTMVDFFDTMLDDVVHELSYFDSFERLGRSSTDAKRLFLATGGVPSRLKDLITSAALVAYRERSRRITMVHFAQGFRALVAARRRLEASKKRRSNRQLLLQAVDQGLIPLAAGETQIQQLIMQMAA